MPKIKVTKQQRANARYALHVMWPFVEPECVIRNLIEWRCGTQACFGGHVAVDPYFQGQDVEPGSLGAPRIGNERDTVVISKKLFGVEDMFSARRYDEDGTDHEIVTKRLKALIKMSEVQKD